MEALLLRSLIRSGRSFAAAPPLRDLLAGGIVRETSRSRQMATMQRRLQDAIDAEGTLRRTRCVTMSTGHGVNALFDYDCKEHHPYVCEAPVSRDARSCGARGSGAKARLRPCLRSGELVPREERRRDRSARDSARDGAKRSASTAVSRARL